MPFFGFLLFPPPQVPMLTSTTLPTYMTSDIKLLQSAIDVTMAQRDWVTTVP